MQKAARTFQKHSFQQWDKKKDSKRLEKRFIELWTIPRIGIPQHQLGIGYVDSELASSHIFIDSRFIGIEGFIDEWGAQRFIIYLYGILQGFEWPGKRAAEVSRTIIEGLVDTIQAEHRRECLRFGPIIILQICKRCTSEQIDNRNNNESYCE